MNSNLAEWAYILGCVTAVAALIFRSLFFFAIGRGVWICENVGIKPSTLLLFSVLCFVFSVATRGR